jgi:hypothetical protein
VRLSQETIIDLEKSPDEALAKRRAVTKNLKREGSSHHDEIESVDCKISGARHWD